MISPGLTQGTKSATWYEFWILYQMQRHIPSPGNGGWMKLYLFTLRLATVATVSNNETGGSSTHQPEHPQSKSFLLLHPLKTMSFNHSI
jgi:hypothetical protein